MGERLKKAFGNLSPFFAADQRGGKGLREEGENASKKPQFAQPRKEKEKQISKTSCSDTAYIAGGGKKDGARWEENQQRKRAAGC